MWIYKVISGWFKAQYEKIKAEKLKQNMEKLKADRIQEKETEKTKVNVQQNIESESSMEEEQDKNGHQGTPSVSNQWKTKQHLTLTGSCWKNNLEFPDSFVESDESLVIKKSIGADCD